MPIALAPLEAALHHVGTDYRSLAPMADTGLAHDHVWLYRDDGDRVARLPKQSQMNLAPETNLAYQAACYRRTAASVHTPQLEAVLVDLEKCRYGLAGFDLAHASLYTSTTWDMSSHAVLTADDVAGFYQRWLRTLSGTPGNAPPSIDTLLACRRAMWLWSLTWCAKWRTQHLQESDTKQQGEDWSAELSDPALIAHVRERVEHYLSLDAIEHVEAEFAYLQTALTA